MRPPAALFRGFRRKCCCANFPIIHLHLHNLFISKGFSHFPRSYPHRYVNSYSAKKIPHFAADSKMRLRPRRRKVRFAPFSLRQTPPAPLLLLSPPGPRSRWATVNILAAMPVMKPSGCVKIDIHFFCRIKAIPHRTTMCNITLKTVQYAIKINQ